MLVQAAWEREDRLNENTLESFLLSWRRARQKQQDAGKEVVQSKWTNKQLRGRGGAGGATEQGWDESGAGEDIVTDMFPL